MATGHLSMSRNPRPPKRKVSKVSKGHSQPEIVATAFQFPYMDLGISFYCQDVIVAHM